MVGFFEETVHFLYFKKDPEMYGCSNMRFSFNTYRSGYGIVLYIYIYTLVRYYTTINNDVVFIMSLRK